MYFNNSQFQNIITHPQKIDGELKPGENRMNELAGYADEAVALRRSIHRRPEEGWTEFETTYRIVACLEKYGYDVKAGIEAVEPSAVLGRNPELVAKAEARALAHGVPQAFLDRLGHYTGAVAELATGRPGPVTVFRFDIDCVLVTESTASDHVPAVLGFASEISGAMHACGHDAHTASGLALAHWLKDHQDELTGRIRLLFHPAEEGTRGAGSMAAKGWVDDADWFFGAHVGDECKLGTVGVIRHGFLATSKMDIHFKGTASHAGAKPEAGRSALSAAAACTLMLEGIPRHSGGATRVAVGTMNAGEGRNVTPAHADMQIEVRGETGPVNDWMTERVKSIVKGVSESYEVEGTVELVGQATSVDSDPEATAVVAKAAETLHYPCLMLDHAGASEDCSVLIRRAQEKGVKSTFFLWGCNHHGHHRPDFDLQDTESLPCALAMLTTVVKETNGR